MEQRHGSKPKYPITRKLWLEERQGRVAVCYDDNSTSSRAKCGCVKQRCSTNRCQCRKAGVTCTELCACSNDDYPCENALPEDDTDEYIHDNDESNNSCGSASDDDEDD